MEKKNNNKTNKIKSKKQKIIIANSQIKIPDKIKDFNFVLNGGDGKQPIEKAWQKKIHRINDKNLIKHLSENKNYGVQCNNSQIIINDNSYYLIIVDFDSKELQDKVINQFPETFTTTSGSSKNCYHLWFASDNNKSFKIFNEKNETLADILGEGKQVIAPGSKHKDGSIYSVVKDIPFAFISYAEIEAILKPYDKRPKKKEKTPKTFMPKGIDNGITDKIYNAVSMEDILKELNVDISKNPTNCPFHSSNGGKCLGYNSETAHCFHCDESWNKFSLIRQGKNLTDKETFDWFAEKSGLMNELKQSRKEFVEAIENETKNNDLKTFIFDENEIIQTKVFSTHLLNNNIFGFGILLPRLEDMIDKKGNVIGQYQRWRPVIITSENRGHVVSKWLQTEYKISYENMPFEMKLKWELKDIDDFIHNKNQIKIDGIELFKSIKAQYEKYLYFRNKGWYLVHSLWDLGTYTHQLFSAYPIFENRGMSGSAKTKTMLVSSFMTLNATDIMTNPSESTLFRETESIRPTKYIDEAEKLFKFTKDGMEADNRVELINSSYSRNGSVPRQEKIGGVYITKWYHVYSPTMISSINGLFGATESRAITQIHTKAPDNDLRGEKDAEDDINDIAWKKIRNNCYRWSLENWSKIYNAYINFDIKTELRKRDLQIWKPILVLAKIIDEKNLLPEIIKFAEELSIQRKNDNLGESSLDYKYLKCFNELILNSNTNIIYIDDIRIKFNNLYSSNELSKSNKSISIHLDKLGFKELRKKDMNGSYYEISKTIFDEIITPLTTDFLLKNDKETEEKSSDSSDSSSLREKQVKIHDEYMTNLMNNNKISKKVNDESDENDENDEYSEQKGNINFLKNEKKHQNSSKKQKTYKAKPDNLDEETAKLLIKPFDYEDYIMQNGTNKPFRNGKE